jgi:acyl-CoA synthetase (AMP-forming)/AMP-acid ligase II
MIETSSKIVDQIKQLNNQDDEDFSSSATAVLQLPQSRNDVNGFISFEAAPIVEISRHLLQPNGTISGEAVERGILPLFPTFASAIPIQKAPFSSYKGLEYISAPTCANGEKAAIAGTDTREPISHVMIYSFVTKEFGPKLHGLGFGRGDRIALVLPNGPELALAILCIVHWASCVPLNACSSHTELSRDLKACGAALVIGLTGLGVGDVYCQHVEEIAHKLAIPFVGLEPSTRQCGVFTLQVPSNTVFSRKHKHLPMQKGLPLPKCRSNPSYPSKSDACIGALLDDQLCKQQSDVNLTSPNRHSDEVLVLFTSGTTGSKKMVSHLLGDMLVATAAISLSWNLTSDDVNCNLMPLFHVGGIVRQVFCPILSGGCVICCPSFDPIQFWSLLEQKKFNWYYAAPTMHQMILQTKKEKKLEPCKLRMIANAAGSLLPSMARELRDTFQACVLPSYGMTECMPISSPPWNYKLERPGTSGLSVGPEIAIFNLDTNSEMPPLAEGNICVRGSPCFHGYSPTTQDSVNFDGKSSFINNGWFNTGDIGYLDKDGYLYVTGRSKEVINRGGEIISPMEVEEAVTLHHDIESAIAFSVKHDFLQEVVGIAVVPEPNRPRLDLQSLHEYLGDNRLTTPKWPQCLVFMKGGLPKSTTNKLLRVKLAERLGLPVMTDNMHPIERTFEAECPPHGSPLNVPIPSWPVIVDVRTIQTCLVKAIKENSMSDLSNSNFELLVLPHKARKGQVVCYIKNMDVKIVVSVAEKCIHRYEVPSFFIPVENLSNRSALPSPAKEHSIKAIKGQLFGQPGVSDEIISELQSIFQKLLDLDYEPQPESNFFNLGGSSMLASKLAASIRQKYKIGVNGSDVFHHGM